MEGKSLLLSKTFWANLVAVGIIVAQSLDIIPGGDYATLEAGILGMVNILLRIVTNQPISFVDIQPVSEVFDKGFEKGLEDSLKKEKEQQ